MARVFAVIVQASPDYAQFLQEHPEHMGEQIAWFEDLAERGTLIAGGPFLPRDGTGLWLLRAESEDDARAIVHSSPRAKAGILSEDTRVVEWGVSFGADRFASEDDS